MHRVLLVLFVTTLTAYGQSVVVRASNANPNPGDVIYLEYTYPTKPKDMPKTLWSYVASIRLVDRYQYSYIYEVRTFKAGKLFIPSFAVQSEGRQVHSPNVEIPVGKQNYGK